MYQPTLARFMSRDPVANRDADVLFTVPNMRTNVREQSYHAYAYAYADNDPVNNVDPTGLDVAIPEIVAVPGQECKMSIVCTYLLHCGIWLKFEGVRGKPWQLRLEAGRDWSGNLCVQTEFHKPPKEKWVWPLQREEVATTLPQEDCVCLANYYFKYSTSCHIPYAASSNEGCNSNFIPSCALKACGIDVTWAIEPPGWSGCIYCAKWYQPALRSGPEDRRPCCLHYKRYACP
jgi:RHS repeat-associated protein